MMTEAERIEAIRAIPTLAKIHAHIWKRRHEADVTDAERMAWRQRESELKK